MLDDRETYKYLKINLTASTSKEVSKFVINLLDAETIT